jgi:hypothetical protein
MLDLKLGDKVIWKGSWGRDEAKVATVTRIEIDGVLVPQVPWGIVQDFVVVGLDNGHWAYGYQIKPEVA